MERKTLSQVQIYVRDAVNRAGQQAANKNFAGAIETLLPVLRRNPDVPLLFDRIRDYELKLMPQLGGGAKFLSVMAVLFKAPFIGIIGAKDPIRGIIMCENVLASYVDNPAILGMLASFARSAGAPWAEANALLVDYRLRPKNLSKAKQYAEALQRNGQALDALKVHQEMLKKLPADSLAQRDELRQAMALASIERGKFNDKKNTGANTADAEEALLQQLLNGTIHDAGQANVIITRFSEELKHNDSIDMRRKLADAYMVAGEYEKAYDEYKHVADKLGVTDPVLDKHIEKAYLAQLQESIDTLRANPEAYENAEAQIADLEKEYQSYKWRHTVQRAKLFVNDMQLQFDLGVLQFEHNMLDEAIATFTKVAENPQKSRHSLVYLARCELLKQQPAEAEAHLDEALQEMARMDKYKREALYYHGIALEKLGNKEKALDRYSLIHANMSNYRDVPQRIAVLNGDTAIEVHDPEN